FTIVGCSVGHTTRIGIQELYETGATSEHVLRQGAFGIADDDHFAISEEWFKVSDEGAGGAEESTGHDFSARGFPWVDGGYGGVSSRYLFAASEGAGRPSWARGATRLSQGDRFVVSLSRSHAPS